MTEPEIIPPEEKPRRPAEFTDEIFDVICDRMAGGEGLRKICEDPQMPSRQTFLRWIEKDTGRQAQYTAAREALMDWYAEEILTIAWDSSKDTIPADGKKPARCDNEWVNRSRLKVDTLKFLMAKLHPKRYGDRLPETVEQRTHEMGIRAALGASKGDLLRLILRSGILMAGIGLLLGFAGAFGLTRLLANLLFGVGERDPMTLGTVAALLAFVALLACYIPARRATRVDPMVALRYE